MKRRILISALSLLVALIAGRAVLFFPSGLGFGQSHQPRLFDFSELIVGTQGAPLESLFRQLSPPLMNASTAPEGLKTWRFAVPSTNSLHFKSCAVVGNSQNLLNSGYGGVIDQHDMVIRMNQGPTVGFEKDVGSKTTWRLIHLLSLPEKPKDVREQLILFVPEWSYLKDVNTRWLSEDVSNVWILNPDVARKVNRAWLKYRSGWPSTGLLAIAMALSVCDEVSIFGFGADQHGRFGHYYESKIYQQSSTPHRFDIEGELAKSLEANGCLHAYPSKTRVTLHARLFGCRSF